MNFKRIAAFAALATLVCSAVPALSATTQTGTITVKWNTQALAQLNIHTGYTTTFAHAGAATIVHNYNGGSGVCTTPDASNLDLTVDFGAVSPDFANYTNCLEEGSAIMSVATNSTSWNLGEAATAGYPVSACSGKPCFTLCAYANNGASAGKHGAFPVTTANMVAGTVPSGTVAGNAVSNTVGGACAADAGNAGALIDASGTTTNLVNGVSGGTSAYTTASPAYVGEDIELAVAANAPAGAQSVTETITLTAN